MRKLVFVLLAVVCLGVLPGCRTRYVVRTEEKVKTEYKTKTVRDSVYFSDTVRVLQKGDTVFVEKIKYTQKYKTLADNVLRVDTVVQVKRESSTSAPPTRCGTLQVWGILSTAILLFILARWAVSRVKRFL